MQTRAPAPRHTRQRAAVAAVLAEETGFRTAQQVFDALRSAGHRVGLATVYRNLQVLADAGELDVLRTPDGELSYRQCASEEHHHHLVCRSCGRTVEVDAQVVEEWAARVGAQAGFRDVGHDLEFFGLCSAC